MIQDESDTTESEFSFDEFTVTQTKTGKKRPVSKSQPCNKRAKVKPTPDDQDKIATLRPKVDC